MARKYLTESELNEVLMNSDSEEEFVLYESDQENDTSDSELENGENVASSSNSNKNDDELENEEIAASSSNTSTSVPKANHRKVSMFDWEKGNLQPAIHNFVDNKSGCMKENFISNPSIVSSFKIFFTVEFVEKIVVQINNFHKYVVEQGAIEDKSRIAKWKDTDADEIYCFLAIAFLMAQLKKQKINAYWSTDTFLSTPIFLQIMGRDRYLSLLRMLHFSDNNTVEKEDSLFKLRMVIDHLKPTFRNVLYPFQNVCIDESLMLFKGRLAFKQYIPSKRHRFGIKLFLLCDCETGYILDFIIYTGSNTEIKIFNEDLKITGNIVYTLMEPYLNQGHTLFVDNWYTSPLLFDRLHRDKTNACGTVKANRKHMPPMKEKVAKGELVSYKTTNMLALKWVDKREVRMLTTLHSNNMKDSGKKTKQNVSILKPECVLDYNCNMGAVDRTDMLLSTTESVRKSIKWYKKLFFHLLDLSLLNAHVLYNITTGKNIPLADFQLSLVKEIIAEHHKIKPRASTSSKPDDAHSPLRLIERHFPSMYEATEENKRPPCKRCVVCAKSKIRKETRYTCVNCNVPLCVVPCFERYHVVKNF